MQDVFAAGNSSRPIVSKALTFIATEKNAQWLGKASLEDLAQQIATAEGPSGRNCDYLHQLAESLLKVRSKYINMLVSCCSGMSSHSLQ